MNSAAAAASSCSLSKSSPAAARSRIAAACFFMASSDSCSAFLASSLVAFCLFFLMFSADLFASGNKDSLQVCFLKGGLILMVVALHVLVGNASRVILQLLAQLFGEHSNPGNPHQLFEFRTLVQTHLVRFVDHDQGNAILGCQLFSSWRRNCRSDCVDEPLELGASDHGLAIGRPWTGRGLAWQGWLVAYAGIVITAALPGTVAASGAFAAGG